jgi:hypothetical protein
MGRQVRLLSLLSLVKVADTERCTIHNATWDYNGKQPRHGTNVTSLAEKPYFDPAAPTRREALGLLDGSDEP